MYQCAYLQLGCPLILGRPVVGGPLDAAEFLLLAAGWRKRRRSIFDALLALAVNRSSGCRCCRRLRHRNPHQAVHDGVLLEAVRQRLDPAGADLMCIACINILSKYMRV